MEYEVVLPKGVIRQVSRIVFAAVVVIALIWVGQTVSPTEQGKPKLLSPHLAAITAYQREARRWAVNLQDIQSSLVDLLSHPSGDLLSQDQQGNLLYGRLLGIAEEVDGSHVPPTLETLQVTIQDSVAAMLEASLSVTSWINEPSLENQASAEAALKTTSDSLQQINSNPWIIQP